MIYTCPATEKVMIIERATCDDIIFNEVIVANHGAELFNDALHEGMTFDISTEYYQECERLGLLVSYTVTDPAEILIGYMMFIVIPCPRFKGTHQANCDAIYLEKEYRATTFGKQMITYAENDLKELGVNIIYHSTSVQRNYGPVLERVGYHHTETVYARRLV